MMCCYDKLFFFVLNNRERKKIYFHIEIYNYCARNHDIFKLVVGRKKENQWVGFRS